MLEGEMGLHGHFVPKIKPGPGQKRLLRAMRPDRAYTIRELAGELGCTVASARSLVLGIRSRYQALYIRRAGQPAHWTTQKWLISDEGVRVAAAPIEPVLVPIAVEPGGKSLSRREMQMLRALVLHGPTMSAADLSPRVGLPPLPIAKLFADIARKTGSLLAIEVPRQGVGEDYIPKRWTITDDGRALVAGTLVGNRGEFVVPQGTVRYATPARYDRPDNDVASA